MSNLIPPLLSTSPPPIGSFEDNDDDEFGDFTNAIDNTLEFDAFSTPDTPEESPKRIVFDINSNKDSIDKDYQDRRKDSDDKNELIIEDSPNNEVPSDVDEMKVPDDIGNFVSQNVNLGEQNVPSSIETNVLDDNADDVVEDDVNQNADEDEFTFECNVMQCDFEFNESIINNQTNTLLGDDIDVENKVTESIIDTETNEIKLADDEDDDDDDDDDNDANNDDGDDDADHFVITENAEPEANDDDIKEDAAFEATTTVKTETDNQDDNFVAAFDDSEDDDFGDFVASETAQPTTPEENKDFASFEKFENTNAFECKFDTASDDDPPISLLNQQDVKDKSTEIILNMFDDVASSNTTNEDYIFCDFTTEDCVFKEIKDVTDTNALSYQWAKSTSQKCLLKSLNIDTRNILYGAGRNGSMPKFAATLGSTPLEPVKSTTPSITSQSVNTTNSSDNIPTAQFDWSESGLANPLDSTQVSTMLLDLEQLVASLDLTTSSIPNVINTKQEHTKTVIKNELDDWDLWLQSVSKEEEAKKTVQPDQISLTLKSFDSESVNSLQFDSDPKTTSTSHDVINFNPASPNFIESNEQSSWTNTSVPLKETYICNQDAKKDFQWIASNENNATTINTMLDDDSKKAPDFGWFDDAKIESESEPEPGWLKPTILTPTTQRKDLPVVNNEGGGGGGDDEDFSDFQMSLPLQSALKVLPVTTPPPKTEEILQPEVKTPAPILWPDPGITEDELERLELYTKSNEMKKTAVTTPNNVVQKSEMVERKLSGNGGLLLVEKSVVVPADKVVLPSNEVILPPNNKVVISKDLVLPILDSSPRKYAPLKQPAKDDDDWTDFMSSQVGDRISTPELPLSIPQLSNIQPPKPPIPVITPNGLMQTKIPSSIPTPLTPSKSQPHINLHINPPPDAFHPSIISQQFAAQCNLNGIKQNYQTTSIPANTDDDEWSDFMSSQPVPTNNRNNQPINYNIITNPVHYDVNSLSQLPDLDFATPKARPYYNKQ